VLDGAPTNAAKIATQTGTKDKFYQFFHDQLSEICRTEKKSDTAGKPDKTEEVKRSIAIARARMPTGDAIFNPAFSFDGKSDIPTDIRSNHLILFLGLDPTQDTPCKILHVILLGLVKYFWRNSVKHLSPAMKQLLIRRLDSLNVKDLSLSKLSGATLVNYAGSLTGRDFRAIVQVAPAVLYGLICSEEYEAWLALSRLGPAVFQPDFDDLEVYLVRDFCVFEY
jgi:hypothetical protein